MRRTELSFRQLCCMQAIILGVVNVVGRLAGLTHLVLTGLIQHVDQTCISADGVQVFGTGLV